ncbi:hypothetical protein SAMN04488120_103202 [Fontimonas thermophila]|uniref:Uncharacterized protein n=1 Tax=Fontimonas thermophila TaxID=1076937 RepID=A0A1I2IBZ7_9GAMM|nr:hypothetical protein [Fontimonas thermophila]SFF39764.1 hypothetical protein SAMN04488120_103202 [Fontimonas thermophila]
MAGTVSLYDSAFKRARVVRQGDLTQVIIDGGGAFVVSTQEFLQVRKWAQSKAGSQNVITDRGRVFEQFTVLIARPGTQAATRGHRVQLEKLADAMKQAGYDLSEWALPPELKHLGRPLPDAPGGKKDADAAADSGP